MLNFSYRSYNDVGYSIIFNGYNKDVTLTQSSPVLNISENQQKNTDADRIISIRICNSIEDMIPTLQLVYQDKGFSLTTFLKQQNLIFKLVINHDVTGVLNNNWILKSFKILSSNQQSIRYQLFFDNQIALNLYRICHLATSKGVNALTQAKQSPYQLAQKILRLSGLTLYPEIYDANGVKIRNRQSLPTCDVKTSFITNANMKAIDSMMYLFSVGSSSGQDSPAYFIYNLIDHKCFITTFDILLNTTYMKEQPNSTTWPFSFIQMYNLGKYHQIKNLVQINTDEKIGGIEASKLLFNYEHFEFNHLTREWETSKISKNSIISTVHHGLYDSIFDQSYSDSQNQKVYSFPASNEFIMYDTMRKLEIYSSCIRFEVDGDINLDIGHVINVVEGSSKTDKLLNGQWIISKVTHLFYQQTYKTILQCCRTSKMKES